MSPSDSREPRGPRSLRGSRLFGAVLASVALACVGPAGSPPPLAAQAPVVDLAGADTSAPEADRSFWSVVAGQRADRRRLTLAMFAMHPFEPQFPELDWTWGVAFSWSHWFLSSFINSYDERAWIAGIERTWARGATGPLEYGVGYRVGVVTGYDERLISWAEYTPVLPFAGVLLWSDAGPLGVDVYYVYRAITLEGSIRF